MKSTILSARDLTTASAAELAAGFLAARKARHGDATMRLNGDPDDGGDPGGDPDGGDPDSGPPPAGTRPAPSDPADPHYFPPNTAVAEMTPTEQANYHRHQGRIAQDRQRAAERRLAELEPKAREYDDLVAAQRSDSEVAIDEALEIGREEGRAEIRQEAATEFLRSQLSTGRTDEQVNTLMRGLNPVGFLTDDGAIDYAGIRTFAATLGGGSGAGPDDIGQGRRGGAGKPSVAGGRSLFQDRRPKTGANAG